MMKDPVWARVDNYLESRLGAEDEVLRRAQRVAAEAGLPAISVTPLQGKFLHVLARLMGARRVLEIGALGGYSAIWLGRALPPGGTLYTLEVSPQHARVAGANIADAGLADKVKVIVGPALDTLAALWRCWRLGVDVTFDLEFFTRYSALVAYLSGAPNRIGFWSRISWRGDLITHPVYYNGTKHIARVFVALAEAAGQPWDEGDLGAALAPLPPDPDVEAGLDALLRAAGLDPARPLLLVNPNASPLCLERRWMPERFAATVDQLQDRRPGLQAIFLGGGSEAGFTAGVAGLCQGAGPRAVLAGRLSLRQLLALLRRGALFLTNDSGPLHLATLTGTPTVALFGPETPTLYGPLGRRQKAFYAGVYCSPCLNVFNSKTAPCGGDNICMQALSQEAVTQACLGLLAAA